MFNNKVPPDKYQEIRNQFLNFCASHLLTINEAETVLQTIGLDLKNQVCSGRIGIQENTICK